MTFSTPTNLVPAQGAALSAASEVPEVASFNVKAGLAQMLKVLYFQPLTLSLLSKSESRIASLRKRVTHKPVDHNA